MPVCSGEISFSWKYLCVLLTFYTKYVFFGFPTFLLHQLEISMCSIDFLLFVQNMCSLVFLLFCLYQLEISMCSIDFLLFVQNMCSLIFLYFCLHQLLSVVFDFLYNMWSFRFSYSWWIPMWIRNFQNHNPVTFERTHLVTQKWRKIS